MAAILDKKIYLNKERLWSLFKYFDHKNRNYLELKDIKYTIAREGRVLPENNLKEIFKEIKADGKIDFADFCRIMHQDLDEEKFIPYFEANYSSPTKPAIK